MLIALVLSKGSPVFINPAHVVLIMETGQDRSKLNGSWADESDVYLLSDGSGDANIIRVRGDIYLVAALLNGV